MKVSCEVELLWIADGTAVLCCFSRSLAEQFTLVRWQHNAILRQNSMNETITNKMMNRVIKVVSFCFQIEVRYSSVEMAMLTGGLCIRVARKPERARSDVSG